MKFTCTSEEGKICILTDKPCLQAGQGLYGLQMQYFDNGFFFQFQ